MGVNLLSVTTINEIVNILNNKGLIDENTLESVIKQKMDEELEYD
jgi:hypothetical protein